MIFIIPLPATIFYLYPAFFLADQSCIHDVDLIILYPNKCMKVIWSDNPNLPSELHDWLNLTMHSGLPPQYPYIALVLISIVGD